jgi:hypothetical protein
MSGPLSQKASPLATVPLERMAFDARWSAIGGITEPHHGFFLDAEFCKRFWSPFLQDGTLFGGANKPESPVFWLQLLSIVKIKYFILLVILLLFGYIAYGNSGPLLNRLYGSSITVPNPLTIGTKEDLDIALKNYREDEIKLDAPGNYANIYRIDYHHYPL